MLIQELPCLDSNIAGQLLLIEFCNKIGPTRKWLSVPTTSAFWGTPDSLCSPRAFPSLTLNRHAALLDDVGELALVHEVHFGPRLRLGISAASDGSYPASRN